jgi:transketolase
MVVGLGAGSTALLATQRIGQLLRKGQLRNIIGFPCSRAIEAEARSLGIPLTLDPPREVDLAIDGADEVDPALNLIKGGGGALLHEKIVAQVSLREVIVVDESKLSPALGTHWPLPVEVIPFGWHSQKRFLESLGARVSIRQQNDGTPFRTDQGNMILDCAFGAIREPAALAAQLDGRTGIVEHGLFIELATSDAASLAGHLKLANLCWIYDNNRITIEGHTALTFSEDVATRFLGYGWNVTRVGDANDLEMLTRAFAKFKRTQDGPTLIIVDSHIAYGAPHKEDTSAAHGEPLGAEEIRLTKRNYDWPEDAQFLVPESVYEHFREEFGKRGRGLREAWLTMFEAYRRQYPELAEQGYRMFRRQLSDGWDQHLPSFPADPKGLATRETSGQVLNAVAQSIPWLIGGAADLAPSTKTRLTFDGAGDFSAANYGGRNLHFGIREHAMGAILNGLSLCQIRPFGSGFLIFSDYGRGALRLSALMELPVIYIFTHDSISVGDDGPTHQPVEHLASLRAIPGLITLRPADANEVVEAWRLILQLQDEPAALILSRQALPTLDRSRYASASGLAKGAYVLADAKAGRPDVLLLATGSEVALCLEAYEKLTADGVKTRVVSMPSWELFERQSQEYRDHVLPPEVSARVSVEEASTFGWSQYVGATGQSIGMRTFGASAPLKELQKKFGFTPEHVVTAAKAQLARRERFGKERSFI